MKRTLALFLSVLLLLALLTGCGSKSAPRDSAAGSDYMMTNQSYAKTDESFAYDEPELPTPDAENGYWDGDDSRTLTGGMTAPGDAKMIYRASIEVQTQDYTTSESAITELVKSCGGYFESKSLSNRSSGYRYGEFTVRVPAKEYERFCAQVGTLCHVTWQDDSAENISEQYYDTQSRLETAQIKLERLQELLSKADNMADIITIESAISDTEYEIESLSGTLRHYDALVDYATVSLTLSETYKLDENEGAPLTFGARIARAFTNGLRDTGVFLEDLAIGIANNLVFLAVLAAFIMFKGTINEKPALQDLELYLAPGDFVTVIGGNGAGKSTMLNAVAGVWPVDEGKMQAAALRLLGTHDFGAFQASGGTAKSTIRTLYDISVTREGDDVTIVVAGSAFLYNMVRILAGTLVAIGQDRLSPDALDEALATQNRLALGVTAPASGLELTRIFYDLDGERPEKWSVNDKYIGDFPVDE